MRENHECEVLSGTGTFRIETFRSVRTRLNLVRRPLPSGLKLDDGGFPCCGAFIAFEWEV